MAALDRQGLDRRVIAAMGAMEAQASQSELLCTLQVAALAVILGALLLAQVVVRGWVALGLLGWRLLLEQDWQTLARGVEVAVQTVVVARGIAELGPMGWS